jgi:hypothetical protein
LTQAKANLGAHGCKHPAQQRQHAHELADFGLLPLLVARFLLIRLPYRFMLVSPQQNSVK